MNKKLTKLEPSYWYWIMEGRFERGELKEDEEVKFEIEDFETKITDVEEEL